MDNKDMVVLLVVPALGIISLGTSLWLSGFCFGIVFWHLGYIYKKYMDWKKENV